MSLFENGKVLKAKIAHIVDKSDSERWTVAKREAYQKLFKALEVQLTAFEIDQTVERVDEFRSKIEVFHNKETALDSLLAGLEERGHKGGAEDAATMELLKAVEGGHKKLSHEGSRYFRQLLMDNVNLRCRIHDVDNEDEESQSTAPQVSESIVKEFGP